jgi:RNA polymerase sigma-70 factor (ECF subfamily)
MSQDDLYDQVANTFGSALGRLARSYEGDPEKRRDLLQDIHFAIWRSLGTFDGRCSLRTWTYRVAHNVATSYVLKHRRAKESSLASLEEIDDIPEHRDSTAVIDRQMTLDRLYRLIQQLHAVDRETIILYLEGLDAASIAEITGISAVNVATKIHRIKKILSKRFAGGARHDA